MRRGVVLSRHYCHCTHVVNKLTAFPVMWALKLLGRPDNGHGPTWTKDHDYKRSS